MAGAASTLLLLVGAFMALKHRTLYLPVITLFSWALLNTVFMKNSLNSYDEARAMYMAKIHSGGDLSFHQKTNVYFLNVFMSLGAAVVYPEIAVESLLMMFPVEHGERRFNSGFFLRSKWIQKKIKGLNRGESVRVSWNLQHYLLGGTEARYALALNPCLITRRSDGAADIYEARVKVGYPAKSEVMLIHWPAQFRIEEGLFWYLQQCGWLHPYEAVWTCMKE